MAVPSPLLPPPSSTPELAVPSPLLPPPSSTPELSVPSPLLEIKEAAHLMASTAQSWELFDTEKGASKFSPSAGRRKKNLTDKQSEINLHKYFRAQKTEDNTSKFRHFPGAHLEHFRRASVLPTKIPTPKFVSFPDHWRKLLNDRYLRPLDIEEAQHLRERRKKTFEIRVRTVNQNLQVYKDDSQIFSLPSNNSDGVHVLSIAQEDGRTLLRRSFRTGEPAEGELLTECLGNLQSGNLVLIVMMFASGDFLRSTERHLLFHLGMKGDGVGGAIKLGADFSQGIHNSPYNIDKAQVRRVKQMKQAKKPDILYEVLVLNKNGTETKELLPDVKNNTIQLWNGYVDADEPSVLLSTVPHGWPPQSALDVFRPRVYIESAVVIKGNRNGAADMEVMAVLQRRKRWVCAWHKEQRRHKQAQFCGRYDGYGTLCRCKDPLDPALLRHSAKSFLTTEIIPVAMLTAFKTYFFYRQLISLLLAEGSSQTPILVLTDGYQEETSQLADLFGLPVIEHQNEGVSGTSTPLNAHFRFSLYTAFSTYTNASKIIILEDDLIVSPDFIRYFHQTAWLLEADPSIYVVNSFSLNSYASVAEDTSRLRRSEIMPQFGWMVTRNYAEEIIHYWVDNSKARVDWDWWLRLNHQKRKRHALVPEVSRTLHSGSSGAHVSGWDQAFIFSNMIYNLDPKARLKNLHLLQKDAYYDHILHELLSSHRLNLDFSPCFLDSIPMDLRPGPVLISVFAESERDLNSTLLALISCLHTFPTHTADHYEGVLQYTLTTITPHTRLYVIACPMSPYCSRLSNLETADLAEDVMVKVIERDYSWRSRKWFRRTATVKYFSRNSSYYSPDI
ncbi:Glycosyl transferase family 13 [Trinorchestia longiramus]|nr:Glycosyl transferase family 13 [Trinorchestia longiramus]